MIQLLIDVTTVLTGSRVMKHIVSIKQLKTTFTDQLHLQKAAAHLKKKERKKNMFYGGKKIGMDFVFEGIFS